MNDNTAELHAIVAAAIAPLAARIDQLFAQQQEYIQSLAQATARLEELTQYVADLRGNTIWAEASQ